MVEWECDLPLQQCWEIRVENSFTKQSVRTNQNYQYIHDTEVYHTSTDGKVIAFVR